MNIAVYCGSSPLALPHLKAAARELGTWIGGSGNALVYGGSSIGLMGEVSAATLRAGGEAYGVEPQFFIDAGVAQHDLTQLHVVETMEERKALMIELADVFVALPGGVGTLEEISEIMSRIRLQMTPGPCYFLDLDGFYQGLQDLVDRMVDAQFIERQQADAGFVMAKSTEELISMLEARAAAADDELCEAPVVPESNLRMGQEAKLMAMLTVRVATRDDFQDIVDLYQAVSAEVSGTDNDPIWEVGVYPTHEDIQGYMDAGELYVAEKDGRIAGAIVATSNTEEGYKDVAWISDIPVEDSAVIHLFGMHPDLRGQGLARPFMEAVEEKLRARGERIMRLDVIAANVGAQRVYDRFGFTHCGTAWLEYPDYQGDFAFYEKEL